MNPSAHGRKLNHISLVAHEVSGQFSLEYHKLIALRYLSHQRSPSNTSVPNLEDDLCHCETCCEAIFPPSDTQGCPDVHPQCFLVRLVSSFGGPGVVAVQFLATCMSKEADGRSVTVAKSLTHRDCLSSELFSTHSRAPIRYSHHEIVRTCGDARYL